ncbi:hypothetical protein C8R44DRAFT_624241 [Mycena epipterygia]|nr:hypothetical protein C8R44DRAFT_624241 [Mycena epipterygia]
MSESLQEKLALIIGCSGGIGQATARTLALRGCSIAVHYHFARARTDALVAELTKLPGVCAHAFQANLADYDGVTLEEFEQTWKVNTAPVFSLLSTFPLTYTYRESHSVAAGIGGVAGPHYASSKSALHGLVHWLAVRYTKEGITCNAVAPALIDGPLRTTDTTMMANQSDQLKNMIPIGHLRKPHEVASVVEMLVTNAYLTNKVRTRPCDIFRFLRV